MEAFKRHVDISFLNEYMVGSIFFKYRASLSRSARMTILMASLFTELTVVGVLFAWSPLNYESKGVQFVIALLAVACCVPIGPIFNMVFYMKDTLNYRAGTRVGQSEFIFFALLISYFVICTGLIIYLLIGFAELRVHYWVWCFVYCLVLEFLVVQFLKAVFKYVMIRRYEDVKGNDLVEYLKAT
jgi:hypothetical protein